MRQRSRRQAALPSRRLLALVPMCSVSALKTRSSQQAWRWRLRLSRSRKRCPAPMHEGRHQ